MVHFVYLLTSTLNFYYYFTAAVCYPMIFREREREGWGGRERPLVNLLGKSCSLTFPFNTFILLHGLCIVPKGAFGLKAFMLEMRLDASK